MGNPENLESCWLAVALVGVAVALVVVAVALVGVHQTSHMDLWC